MTIQIYLVITLFCILLLSVHSCFCLYIAKWQAMCIFKELQNDQEGKDGTINEEQFYRLYIVKDVRWKLISHSGRMQEV